MVYYVFENWQTSNLEAKNAWAWIGLQIWRLSVFEYVHRFIIAESHTTLNYFKYKSVFWIKATLISESESVFCGIWERIVQNTIDFMYSIQLISSTKIIAGSQIHTYSITSGKMYTVLSWYQNVIKKKKFLYLGFIISTSLHYNCTLLSNGYVLCLHIYSI